MQNACTSFWEQNAQFSGLHKNSSMVIGTSVSCMFSVCVWALNYLVPVGLHQFVQLLSTFRAATPVPLQVCIHSSVYQSLQQLLWFWTKCHHFANWISLNLMRCLIVNAEELVHKCMLIVWKQVMHTYMYTYSVRLCLPVWIPVQDLMLWPFVCTCIYHCTKSHPVYAASAQCNILVQVQV